MKHQGKRALLQGPVFQVVATWIWNLVGTLVVMAVVAVVLPSNIALDRTALKTQPLLALIPILSEVVLVGLLPIIFALLSREPAARYGLTRKGLASSLALSAVVVGAYFAFLSLRAGQLRTSVTLLGFEGAAPGNILLALLALLAYGPLEVFFVVWLIHTTDHVFKQEAAVWSAGLLLTIVVYGLLHAFSQGMNSIVIALEFLALGLIYKSTGNAVGPMLAFMVMNEYAWFLAKVFLP